MALRKQAGLKTHRTRLQRQAIFWHFPGYLDSPVIRGQLDDGRDKLATNSAVELYNLTDDIGERNNLANAKPVKRNELLDDLFAWFKSADAIAPTQSNPMYDPQAKAGALKQRRNQKR